MATQDLDTLLVRIAADTSQLRGELAKATAAQAKAMQAMAKETEKLNTSLDKVAGRIKGAIMGALSGLSVRALVDATRQTLEWADNMTTLADRLGLSTDALQELAFAGRESNLSFQEMTQGLTRFRTVFSEAASGKGEAVQALKAIGLGAKDSERDLDDLLKRYAEAIRQFDRPSQIAISKALFGDEGAIKFLDLLGQGAGKIDALSAKARELGIVIDRGALDAGTRLNKKFEEMRDVSAAGVRSVLLDFTPALEKAIDAIIRAQKEMANLGLAVNDITTKGAFQFMELFPGVTRFLQDRARDAGLTTPGGQIGNQFNQPPGTPPPNFSSGPFFAPPAGPGTRKINLDSGASSAADQFRKQIADMQRDAKALRDNLQFDKATAEFNKLVAAFAAGNEKFKPSAEMVRQFTAALADKNMAAGAVALKDFATETEHVRQVTAAELAGRKDLVAVLELEYKLRQQFGAKFVEANKAQIEQQARMRYQLEENARIAKQGMADLEDLSRSAASTMLGNFGEFFDRSKNGWDVLRDRALNVLSQISNKLFELAMNDLFYSIFGGERKAGISSLLGAVFKVGASAIGGGVQVPTFAEGGRPPLNAPSLIGERGPELFIPDVPGTIIPNGRFATGGTTYIDARGADQAAVARLEQIVRQQGQDVRRWQAGERDRIPAYMYDVRRRGGAVANAFG